MLDGYIALVLILIQAHFANRLARKFVMPKLHSLKSRASAIALLSSTFVMLANYELAFLASVNPLDGTNCQTAPALCALVSEGSCVIMVIAAALLPLTYLYTWTVGAEIDERFDWQARTH